ncbi:glycosyltransferase [Massilia sp. CF038]|uniref:glycosyltransferase n=1 Tax=Massilia sp. CF038 TaxID=1881045 RepID=UPI0009130B24|nr:glycosyltransferase [Massilia sp. CF038]SHH56376.1 Glycosyltransferase sugar-binding region containing DXD motif-containing protein [Massilia sp. CF038]
MNDFMTDVTARLEELKAAFIAIQQWQAFEQSAPDSAYQARVGLLRENYQRRLRELRQAVRTNFAHFDASRTASLMALPTLPLDAAERRTHRIWLGGPLPAMAVEAARQWQCAIDGADADFASALWVWDAQQLQADPRYVASVGPGYRIGSCVAAGVRLEVCSLRELALARMPAIGASLEALHAQGCYVNLADFFRLLILHEEGGIYLDVDTMPYRGATLFLACPEVPDYVLFAPAPQHICWMNLVDDENGMLVAKRHTPALATMLAQMASRLALLAAPDRGALHDATYAVWRAHMGQTFTSYQALAASHAILHDETAEAVVSGVHGMRLVVDALTGEARPLAPDEQAAYRACTAALAERRWQLPDPLELAQLADLTTVDEIPRMAYAAQLRAQTPGCHYYSFLSHDPQLDRVNHLFGAYLLARNALRIARGQFFSPTRGRAPALHPSFSANQRDTQAVRPC